MSVKIRSPIKTSGGKRYLADWLVGLMPPRKSYQTFLDSMCRSCSVMLAHDPKNVSEIVNDLDYRISNFWKVLQDEALFKELYWFLELTPFSEAEFALSQAKLEESIDPARLRLAPSVNFARDFFVVARMSRAGDMKRFTPLTKTRLRRGMNEQVASWISSIDRLPEIHARIKRWLILDRDVFKILTDFDTADVVAYHDCPYLVEGKNGRAGKNVYGRYDWTPAQHAQFLQLCLTTKHMRHMISGYETDMYKRMLLDNGWKIHRMKQALHSAGGKTKGRRIECCYTNW